MKLLKILSGVMVLPLVCFYMNNAKAQEVETDSKIHLNLYSFYLFDDAVDSYYSNTQYYDGKIKGGWQWGAGVEYKVRPDYGIELLYLRQDTKAPIEYYDNGVKHTNFELGNNYIMAAGARYMKVKEVLEPYFGVMLGACVANLKDPEDGRTENATKFSWGLRGGMTYYPSNGVGIKLQAQLLSVVQSAGGAFYFGTGGAGAGVASYSTIYQFGLGGGLVFRLGD